MRHTVSKLRVTTASPRAFARLSGVMACAALVLALTLGLTSCGDSGHPTGQDGDSGAGSRLWTDISWADLQETSIRLSEASSDDARLQIARSCGLVDDEGHLTNTVRRVDLTNGYSLDVRVIGICHDAREDGTIAGLTLMATGAVDRSGMNGNDTVAGGWERSALRERLASDLMGLFPEDARSAMVPVSKLTNNRGRDDDTSSVTATNDTLWLLSAREVCGDITWEREEYGDERFGIDATLNAEGEQYQYFAEQGVASSDANPCLTLDATSGRSSWWLRTPFPDLSSTNGGDGSYFFCVSDVGNPSAYVPPTTDSAVVVCFCV